MSVNMKRLMDIERRTGKADPLLVFHDKEGNPLNHTRQEIAYAEKHGAPVLMAPAALDD